VTPIRRTWRIVRARREGGPQPTRGDLDSTVSTGRDWVEREIMGPWRIEEGDLVAINCDVTATTLPNLLALKDQMPLEEVIEAAVIVVVAIMIGLMVAAGGFSGPAE
jgi:hypothetical protein